MECIVYNQHFLNGKIELAYETEFKSGLKLSCNSAQTHLSRGYHMTFLYVIAYN